MSSSFSEWMAGAAGPSAMGLDDPQLEDRTLELKRREEELMTERERADRAWAETVKVWTEATGTGRVEDGAVTVVVDAQNRVVDIELTPQAVRLGSIQNLRRALLEACDEAVADVQRQLAQAAGVEVGEDPVAELLKLVPEIAEVLPYELRHPAPRTRAEDDDE